MKKIFASVLAMAMITAAGSVVAATKTANLTVDAQVLSSCIVTGGTIDFGSLDPTTPVVVNTSSTGVEVTCTSGTTWSLSGDDGLNASGTQKRLTDGTNFIAYSVAIPAATFTGTGTAQAVTIPGTIAAGAYSAAPAGAYTDTVVLTVTY